MRRREGGGAIDRVRESEKCIVIERKRGMCVGLRGERARKRDRERKGVGSGVEWEETPVPL